MRILIGSCLCLFLMAGCKKEMSSSSSASETTNQKSYLEYAPNPDEVIMELEFISGEFSDNLWRNEMKVVRQLKAGFGFKDRLRPESTIILLSKEKITLERFHCSAEYQLSVNNQTQKTFVLRQYLTQ